MKSVYTAMKSGGELVVIDFKRIRGFSSPWLMNHVRGGKKVFRAEIEQAGFTFVEEVKIAGFRDNYFLRFVKK